MTKEHLPEPTDDQGPAAANVALALRSPELQAAMDAESRMLAVRGLIVDKRVDRKYGGSSLGIRDSFSLVDTNDGSGGTPALYVDRISTHGHSFVGHSAVDVSAFRPDTAIPTHYNVNEGLAAADARIHFPGHSPRSRGTEQLTTRLTRRDGQGNPTHDDVAFRSGDDYLVATYTHPRSGQLKLVGAPSNDPTPSNDPARYAEIVTEATDVIKAAALTRAGVALEESPFVEEKQYIQADMQALAAL